MSLTLDALNAATPAEFARLLDGTFEQSHWLVERAAPMRPFASLAQLKLAVVRVLSRATLEDTAAIERIAAPRRGKIRLQETMRAPAAPSDPSLQARWEGAVASLGLPVHRMPSGAGHDLMMLHRAMLEDLAATAA